MKLHARVFCACALAILVGPALADQGDCQVELPDGIPNMYLMLTLEAEACFTNISAARYQETRAANTTEQVRLAFVRAYEARPKLTECLEKVKRDAELCLKGVETTKLILSLGLMLTNFDVECLEGCERSATIDEEVRKYRARGDRNSVDVMNNCRITGLARVGLTVDIVGDPNHDMIYAYRKLVDAKECLEKHRGGDQDTLVNAGVAQWTDILDRMMCVDSQDGKEVLCKTIIDAATDDDEHLGSLI